ncbi:MAG: hypothetical protein KGS48_02390 [Bacteroidetes bacterium]|nr:hypothetical protein [Bacteroidota bacterium]
MQTLLTVFSVIIGIVFVLMLFSLFASTVMEIVAALLSLRGLHLLRTLRNMLGEMTNDFLAHPFFRQLAYATGRKTPLTPYSLPSWINKSTFSSILADLMQPGGSTTLEEKINSMPDGDFKDLMLYLLRQTDGSIEQFKARTETWFDEVMDRASDWYKRSTKWWLFGVGFTMAVIFNTDTIQIYTSLSQSATLRDDFVTLASNFVENNDSVPSLNSNLPLEVVAPKLKEMAETYSKTVESPLGLGWTQSQFDLTTTGWLTKLLGWLLSGISVTFGAPFWFEILKKLISIRSGAGAGGMSAPTTVVVNQPMGNGNAGSPQGNMQTFEKTSNKPPKPEAPNEEFG